MDYANDQWRILKACVQAQGGHFEQLIDAAHTHTHTHTHNTIQHNTTHRPALFIATHALLRLIEHGRFRRFIQNIKSVRF